VARDHGKPVGHHGGRVSGPARPQGMAEIGESIMARVQYAMNKLAKIKGVQVPGFQPPHFKEFVVNFDGAGKTVREINKALLARAFSAARTSARNFLNWAAAPFTA